MNDDGQSFLEPSTELTESGINWGQAIFSFDNVRHPSPSIPTH